MRVWSIRSWVVPMMVGLPLVMMTLASASSGAAEGDSEMVTPLDASTRKSLVRRDLDLGAKRDLLVMDIGALAHGPDDGRAKTLGPTTGKPKSKSKSTTTTATTTTSTSNSTTTTRSTSKRSHPPTQTIPPTIPPTGETTPEPTVPPSSPSPASGTVPPPTAHSTSPMDTPVETPIRTDRPVVHPNPPTRTPPSSEIHPSLLPSPSQGTPTGDPTPVPSVTLANPSVTPNPTGPTGTFTAPPNATVTLAPNGTDSDAPTMTIQPITRSNTTLHGNRTMTTQRPSGSLLPSPTLTSNSTMTTTTTTLTSTTTTERPTHPPSTTHRRTKTKTNTWLPSSIEPVAPPKETSEPDPGTSLPEVVIPHLDPHIPPGSFSVHLRLEHVSYYQVINNAVLAAQLVSFLPEQLAQVLDVDSDLIMVLAIRDASYRSKGSRKAKRDTLILDKNSNIAVLVTLTIPEKQYKNLQALVTDEESVLYKAQADSFGQYIDPTFPLSSRPPTNSKGGTGDGGGERDPLAGDDIEKPGVPGDVVQTGPSRGVIIGSFVGLATVAYVGMALVVVRTVRRKRLREQQEREALQRSISAPFNVQGSSQGWGWHG